MSLATKPSARRQTSQSQHECVQRFTPWIWHWFGWHSRRFLRKRFHAVRLLTGHQPMVEPGWPLLVYLNHPGWYDPLVCIQLARRFFADRRHYAPIDSKSLSRYRFLTRIGFYGLSLDDTRGGIQFLRTSERLLSVGSNAVWMTPQGKFTDTRERPVRFRQGLGHLVQRLDRVAILPLALEYAFWTESTPEALVAFGEPIYLEVRDHDHSPAQSAEEWTEQLESHLTPLQDKLAAASVRRSPEEFETLLTGRAGVGGVYDLWRQFKSLVTGGSFSREHGRGLH